MYKPHKRSRSHNGAITSSGYCLIAFYVCSVVLRELDPFRVVVAFQHQTLISHCNDHAGLHRCLKASNDQEPQLQPWTEAIIDYSGANEYFEAHYGKHPFLDLPPSSAPYFGGDKILEPIYNGRELGIVGEDGLLMASKIATTSNNTSTEAELSHHVKSLKKYGMALIDSPTRVIDWKNKKQIENVYIQELEQILPSLFSTKIKLHSFWNPMLRGENHTISAPLKQNSKDTNAKPKGDNNSLGDTISTANVASMVHIDTDVGAYESVDEFLAIVEKNQVRRQEEHGDEFDRSQYQNEIIDNRKRFAVVNFWRNTNPLEPITSSPLSILSTRYDHGTNLSVGANPQGVSAHDKLFAFPNVRPDLEESKWYTFPNMTSNEVLVFYQYDRLVTQPSDLWHCAISIDEDQQNRAAGTEANFETSRKRQKTPRESFDIRVLVVFDEVVEESKDRFQPDRVRPVLSFEESGCFCDEQAEKRSQ